MGLCMGVGCSGASIVATGSFEVVWPGIYPPPLDAGALQDRARIDCLAALSIRSKTIAVNGIYVATVRCGGWATEVKHETTHVVILNLHATTLDKDGSANIVPYFVNTAVLCQDKQRLPTRLGERQLNRV